MTFDDHSIRIKFYIYLFLINECISKKFEGLLLRTSKLLFSGYIPNIRNTIKYRHKLIDHNYSLIQLFRDYLLKGKKLFLKEKMA